MKVPSHIYLSVILLTALGSAMGRATERANIWVPGGNADSYNLYFGKIDPPEFKGNQKESGFDPGRLESNATYFWRVDEVTSDGVVPGELGSFRTRP